VSLKRAFKAFFGNPDWLKKSALAMLGMLVPYVGAIVVMGYGLEYMRGVAWRKDDKLPEWSDLARYLKTGFGAFVVSLVYSLPVIIVLSIVTFIPFIIFATSSSGEAYVVAFAIIIALLSMPLSLAWAALTQGGILRFAAYDKIGEGLRVQEVLASVAKTKGAFWSALWRAWVIGFSVSGVMMLAYGVMYGGIIGATLSGSDEAMLAILPMMYCGQFAVIIVTMALSVLVQLIANHVWGQYLAVAYPEPQYQTTGVTPDPVAQYGAGHTVLPSAPGPFAPPGQPPVAGGSVPPASAPPAPTPPVEE